MTEIKKRRGAYLPHWTREGGWYAVTIRLWDSLPQHVIESWLFERKNIVKTAEQMNRPLSEHEERRLAHLYSEKVERYLGTLFRKGRLGYAKENILVIAPNATDMKPRFQQLFGPNVNFVNKTFHRWCNDTFFRQR